MKALAYAALACLAIGAVLTMLGLVGAVVWWLGWPPALLGFGGGAILSGGLAALAGSGADHDGR